MRRFTFTLLLAIALPSLSASARLPVAVEKIKPQDALAHHLESIGSATERAAVKTRVISGTSQVIFRTNPVGQAIGRAVLASDGVKNLLGMSFPSPVYPREQLGFNGNSFIAVFSTPGTRSVLGNFLMANDLIFKQGLMGGTLSSAWPLLDLTTGGAQLEYAGTKKIDNRTQHELKYLPRGSSDLQVRIYLDEETFQHTRTEYERVIPAPTGSRDYVNVQEREIRYRMVEEFSLFKKEGGLNLPHIYTIKLSVDGQGGTFVAEWVLKLTKFDFNQPIDPAAFNLNAN